MKTKESHRLAVLCGSRRSRISQASSPLLWQSPCFHACGSLAFWPRLRYSSYCEFLKFSRKEMLKGEGWIPFFPSICCHQVANAAMAPRASQGTLGRGTARALVTTRSLAKPPGSLMSRVGSSGMEGVGCLTIIWIAKNLGESQTESNCCTKRSNHIKALS